MGSTKLTANIGASQVTEINVPLVFANITNHTFAADNDFTVTAGGSREVHGVMIKPVTAGSYTVITLKDYLDNDGNLSGADTVTLYLAAYQWSDVSIVFADATNAAGNLINVGWF